MCLAVVALDAHPRFSLVVVANRDEAHARPTRAAHWWPRDAGPPVFGGRDLAAGGTWLALARHGRWAFVTNVREPGRNDPAAPSRGALVLRVIDDPRPVAEALAAAGEDPRYNGYNLIAGDVSRAAWTSNRAPGPRALAAGVHGVSNAALDTPWPKLLRVQRGVEAWIADGSEDVAPLFDLLADRTIAPDDALPSTGVPLALERRLSAAFILSPHYGTRASTVVTIARDGSARFHERSFDADGRATGDVVERFVLAPGGVPPPAPR